MSDKLQGGVLAGSTSVSVSVVLRKTADNTENTGTLAASVTAYYWRQGGTPTALTAASDLAAITSAFSAGGWKAADATNQPGMYRLDVDNAAFATGADWVVISVKVASCYVFYERYNLTTNTVQTGDSFARLGAPAGASIAADLAEIEGETDGIGTDTGGVTTLLTRIPGTVQPQTGDAYARLGAPAGASVSADVAAVKSDTGTINTATVASAVAADVLNAVAVTYNAAGSIGQKINAAGGAADPLLNAVPGSYAPGTAGYIIGTNRAVLAANGLDLVMIEAGLNARQALAVIAAACAGTLFISGNTITINGAGVSTVRIVATTDANSQRTAMALTPPA